MSALTCPAVLISAPASGQGKTLATAALARAWRNRGLNVHAFKCGPDFLDPMLLNQATGQPVYNLDAGMCGENDGATRLYAAAGTADVIIVEGVMGLYDGTPSSADLALRYGLPVLVTIDASGMAQTFAAIASGLLAYEPTLKAAGVLATKVGSVGHAKMLRESLPAHLPWFGSLTKDSAFSIPERHLGLFRAAEITDLDTRINAAADALALSSDLSLPAPVSFEAPKPQNYPQLLANKKIAIAQDAAFCFIYPANLDCLIALGATLAFFSPLTDTILPEADAYWLPGGYPELHLEAIAANTDMAEALKQAHQDGKPLLAECGGMMALSTSINGQPTFGLLPGNSEITPRLQAIGTQHADLKTGAIGAHTFHYGVFASPLSPLTQARSKWGAGEYIYQHGSITASFLHFYFASNPEVAAHFFLA